jgi:hypothetical protein
MTTAGTSAPLPAPPRWAALLGVTAALAMFGAAQGLSYPLFTLLMQRQGMPPALIGLSAAMMPVGLILSAPLIPRAVSMFGARRLAVGCALAAAACCRTGSPGSCCGSCSVSWSTRSTCWARSGRWPSRRRNGAAA